MKYLSALAFTIIMALCPLSNFAQGPGTGPNGGNLQEKKEKLEAMKVTYITNKLALTPKEAQVFWPVYNEYQAKRELLHKERRQLLMQAKSGYANMSDADMEKLMQQGFDLKQRELDLDKQYYAKFKEVLTVKKIALLYKAELDFKKEVLKEAFNRLDE
ncbi:MAG: hypothetical protein SFW35_12350 [Chitinophagales bacterium]|nr:hypothetical protein [Chitinophagales bacterium]